MRAAIPLEDTWGAMGELQDAGLDRQPSASRTSTASRSRRASRSATSTRSSRSSRCSTRETADLIRWCGEQGDRRGQPTGRSPSDCSPGRSPPTRSSRPATGAARSRTTARSRTSPGRSRSSTGSGRWRSGSGAPVPARARVERPPARRHGGDRREPEPRARPRERGRGRHRAGRRRRSRSWTRCSPELRRRACRAATWRSLRASPSSRPIARAGSSSTILRRVCRKTRSDLHGRLRHDRGRPWAAVQRRELAEEVSGDERGHLPTCPRRTAPSRVRTTNSASPRCPSSTIGPTGSEPSTRRPPVSADAAAGDDGRFDENPIRTAGLPPRARVPPTAGAWRGIAPDPPDRPGGAETVSRVGTPASRSVPPGTPTCRAGPLRRYV